MIDHLCRNPACVNPAHLEPVTNRTNIRRGYGPSGLNARKTHCIKGHEYTPENTYWIVNNKKPPRRTCLECSRARVHGRVAVDFPSREPSPADHKEET